MKISENQKVTLTIGQLKKMVNESSSRGAGTLYKNNDVPYSKVFSTSGYTDIRIFGANDEESLVSILISDFDMKEDMAAEIAKHLWKLKQYEAYLNCVRIK